MIHRLYIGRLQIGLDEERHTHENLKFLGILLKHVQWSSKSPGPLVVYLKTPLNENVLFKKPNVQVQTKLHFFSCQMENLDENGLRPDFIWMKTGKFANFCLIIKWRFLENHIRPPYLYSGVLPT